MKQIRGLIREFIEAEFYLEKKIKKDVPFLSDFTLHKKIDNKEKKEVSLSLYKKFDSYLYVLLIKRTLEGFEAGIHIYWNKLSNNLTTNSGKDLEIKFGLIADYSEFVRLLNTKLKNNPVIGKDVFNDDSSSNLSNEIKNLLRTIAKEHKSIHSIDDPYFKQLKDISAEMHVLRDLDDKHLDEWLESNYPSDVDKLQLHLDLQKIDKLDFYKEMKTHS